MNQTRIINGWLKKSRVVSLIVIAVIFLLLSISGMGAKGVIYVDDGASGTMDGSKEHPFNKIQKAIEEAKEEKKDVKILNGTYKENIKILSGVEVYGEDVEKVIIEAKDEGEPTVRMKNNTALRKVTVREGANGISVGENYRVTISECRIIKNRKNGIEAKASKTHNDEKISVINSYIAENGRAGIYAVSRKVDIQDNLIENNNGNGLAMEGGCEGSIKRNKFKDNAGDGLWMVLDWSEIYLDNNTFYDNDREGLEIRSNGKKGLVQITDSKFYKNNRWGLARLEVGTYGKTDWLHSVVFGKNNLFWENRSGDVSHIFQVK